MENLNRVHIHRDVKSIAGKFKDKNGHVLNLIGTEWGYFMQGNNIVKIVYTQKQAMSFYERHEFTCTPIEPLYYWINKEERRPKEKITIRLEPNIIKKVEDYAKEQGRTKSNLIQLAVQKLIDSLDKENK
jgi:hypothetical protein